MEAKGHVFKYGDNVDTDVIIPARYLNSFDPQELASHAMEFRMWFFKRTCSALSENSGSQLHYCRNIRTDFLPEFH